MRFCNPKVLLGRNYSNIIQSKFFFVRFSGRQIVFGLQPELPTETGGSFFIVAKDLKITRFSRAYLM